MIRASGARAGWPGMIRVALTVTLVGVAVVGLRALVVEPVRVASASMAPTLRAGDVVMVNKHDHTPGRGDLITFRSPQDGARVLKRVVGLGGDVVAIEDAMLYVNGVQIREPYVDHESIDALYYGPVTVAAGSVLVMGDSRADSIDSREYGPVPVGEVTGTVVARLWPPAADPSSGGRVSDDGVSDDGVSDDGVSDDRVSDD